MGFKDWQGSAMKLKHLLHDTARLGYYRVLNLFESQFDKHEKRTFTYL